MSNEAMAALNPLLPPGWRPPRVEGLKPWEIVRSLRRRRAVSQRQLAAAAGVPASTIARIESEQVQPRFDTMARILLTCGYVFVVAEAGRQFDPLAEEGLDRRFVDGAGRRPPAHLPTWLIENDYEDPWWGWGRLAWTIKDPVVPAHTYQGRVRRDWGAYERWLDAT